MHEDCLLLFRSLSWTVMFVRIMFMLCIGMYSKLYLGYVVLRPLVGLYCGLFVCSVMSAK